MVRWLAIAGVLGCDSNGSDGKHPSDGSGCPEVGDGTKTAIVTDIDETLTTLDSEWIAELSDPTHDPAMRPDADTLMEGWDALGYRVVYVTARGEGMTLPDGSTAREATTAWLDEHGFPYTDDDVHLAPGPGAFGDGATTYKTGVLTDLQADGVEIDWAYGNADTDIAAYQNAGLADDHIFLVGKLAGTLGVVGISDDDAYTAHLPFLDSVSCGH